MTSLPGAFATGYLTYGGARAPVKHFTRAAAKEFGERGISVNAIGPCPMDTLSATSEKRGSRVG